MSCSLTREKSLQSCQGPSCHSKNVYHGIFELPALLGNFSSIIICLKNEEEALCKTLFNYLPIILKKCFHKYFSQKTSFSLNLYMATQDAAVSQQAANASHSYHILFPMFESIKMKPCHKNDGCLSCEHHASVKPERIMGNKCKYYRSLCFHVHH